MLLLSLCISPMFSPFWDGDDYSYQHYAFRILFKQVKNPVPFDARWLLGRNPWGVSMFTGIPAHGVYPRDVHLLPTF